MARLGCKVALSDREPALLEALHENVRGNAVGDRCRVLRLDWAEVGKPKVGQLLRRQRFTAVIGSDLAYEPGHADLVVNVLKSVLPEGGSAFLVQAKHHRYCHDQFGNALTRTSLPFKEHTVPVTGILQSKFCGSWEPNQEYALYSVAVPQAGAMV